VELDTVEIGGLRIAYRRAGEGQPLVLLHGWPADSREWRRQVEGLSDEFTVVAWDAPGAGRSSDPPETFRLADWADCLTGFIQALGLGPAHMGGLSWGGGLALELYARHPEVIRSLILVSAYAGWGGSLPAEEVERRLQLMVRNSELPPTEWASALVETLLTDRATKYMVEEVTTIVSDLHPVATRRALRAFAEADLREVLPRIDVPTLLLYGEEDVRAPRRVWEPMHSRIPASQIVLVPEVGHMIDIEAAERFNAEVRGFLRSVPPKAVAVRRAEDSPVRERERRLEG
jgi:pimeloyl-ACP methyl ester carboxylesterase